MPKIKIYNLFPGHIPVTAEERVFLLQHIVNMGFTHLYLNPFLNVGDVSVFKRTLKENKQTYDLSGSVYGQTLEKSSDGKDYLLLQTLVEDGGPFAEKPEKSIEDFKKFIQTAKSLGLIPMFDLVLHHVSVDAKLGAVKK